MLQHAVADRVAEAVVDALEVVDVDQARAPSALRVDVASASASRRSVWNERWLPRPVSASVSASRDGEHRAVGVALVEREREERARPAAARASG